MPSWSEKPAARPLLLWCEAEKQGGERVVLRTSSHNISWARTRDESEKHNSAPQGTPGLVGHLQAACAQEPITTRAWVAQVLLLDDLSRRSAFL